MALNPQTTMDWLTVAQLIINIGLPAAEKIVANWENKTPVTLAEFQAVRDAANQTAKDRMLLTLQKAGIDPASDQGKALLAATDAPPNLAVVPAQPPAT